MRKALSIVLALALVLGLCSTALADYQVNEALKDSSVTLTLFGPGVWAVGEEDSTDLVTGVTKPGYHVVKERWAELYPNVTLDIQETGWDSWQTAITTACLSGDVDIIAHGATMVDLTLDLADLCAAEPDYMAQINATASRITTDNPSVYKVSGISVSLNPIVVWCDSEIFEHYGVDLPTGDWTFADMLAIAEKLTGTDPVTGEETYGIQLQAMGQNNLWFNFVTMANSLGATVYEYGATLADCKVNYLCDESIEAFRMIQAFAPFCSPEAKEGLAVDESLSGNNNWAMVIREGPVGAYQEMEANGLVGRYKAVTMPLCTQGRYEGKPTPHAGDNNLAIYKDAKNKELAWEFIKFMTTDPAMIQWVADNGALPNSKDSEAAIKSLVAEEYVAPIMFCLNNIPENYNNATNYVMNNVSFGATTANLITAVSNVLQGFSTPEEAAKLMQDGVDEYLAGLK